MNKLILIGNGFDMSFGLKTSYNDFLLWLIKRELLEALKSGITNFNGRRVDGLIENKLFRIVVRSKFTNVNYNDKVEAIKSIEEILYFMKTYEIIIESFYRSGLINEILVSAINNWVDIEGMYFNLIKAILNKKIRLDIDILNIELEFLIYELEKYLLEIDNEVLSEKSALKHLANFEEDINSKEIYFPEKEVKEIQTDIRYFLNFNYTNTLEKIMTFSKKGIKKEINHIHGKLNDLDNPIIFGFGDEMDKVYKEMEEMNDNRFFKYIKSFHYFKNSSYRKLIRFLDSNDFQVCIYGHSCGLSDRVMLNEIFEHNNCKSIKIYFYKDENDFINKTMEISRHFNDNQSMRKKITEFNLKNEIPQI
ncbi:AbiH family protein [Aquimarina rhabdastrellae]